MIDLLMRLLPHIAPTIRYADNPQRNLWRIDLVVYTVIVYWCDRAIAKLYFDPQGNEKTISDTLERTIFTNPNSLRLAKAIDVVAPGHIKNFQLLKDNP